MKQKKALIMTPTFFRESDYRESGCGAAIERLVDDFGFRYPGIEPSSTSTSTRSELSTTTPGAATCSRRTGSDTSSSRASRPAGGFERSGADATAVERLERIGTRRDER